MATSKTSSFWLTETVQIPAQDAFTNGTIDISAYVDVGDSQSVAIEQVDFVTQAYDTGTGSYTSDLQTVFVGDATIDFQLSDLPFPAGTMLRAGANSLIASGALLYNEPNNVASFEPSLYPDTFGKLDEARMVINDQLYFQGLISCPLGMHPARDLAVTVRIKCRIAKLSRNDWMAIAVQSTASDN